MPDRLLGKHPRLAAYLVLAMALVIFGLSVYVYLLGGRVSDSESLRRSDEQNAEARKELECLFKLTIVDVAIDTPVANINDQLAGTTLTPMERVDRRQARARYLAKKARLEPSLSECVR